MSRPEPPAPRVLVILVDGCEETEAVAPIDLLVRAGVRVVTAGFSSKQATGRSGITIQTDALVADVLDDPWDAIVLPGGPGTPTLDTIPGLYERLRRQADDGHIVAAICAAPSVLARAGLLDGRRAACFPSVEKHLVNATVLHEPVVEDGVFITSRGMGTAVEFGLALVARLVGREKAEEIAQSVVYGPAASK